MIEHLRNMVRAEVERAMARRARRIPVVVDGYDPDRHAVKCKMQPEGTISGWVQIEAAQVGSQFGVMIAPNIGDPGWLEFHEDDFNAGVFVGSSFNDHFKPVAIKAGEILLKHKSGALLYFKDDGSVTLTDKAGSTVLLDGTGTASVTADVINLGSAGQALHKFVIDTFQAIYNAHTHPGINQPPALAFRITPAHLTSTVNAG